MTGLVSPSFDPHEEAIDGVKPDPWGYSRTVDDLIRAPHPPVPARPVAHQSVLVEPWSRKLTVMVIVPPVVLMVVLVGLLIVDMVTR